MSSKNAGLALTGTGSTVLLEVDWQSWIEALGHDHHAVDQARRVRAWARLQRWPVVSSRYLDREPHPEGRHDPDAAAAAFVEGLQPCPTDALITKYGRDVFDAPGLVHALEAFRARHVVITGVATDHGVHLAACGVRARGLAVTVVSDACSGTDLRAHEAALDALRAGGVMISTTNEICGAVPMTHPESPPPGTARFSIAQMAARTGLSRETLRWYEREGLILNVQRDANGHRTYDERAARMIELIVRLRRTRLPVQQIREFVVMVAQGKETHPHRLELLRQHRNHVVDQIQALTEDLAAIDAKAEHYRALIATGRECAEPATAHPTHQ